MCQKKRNDSSMNATKSVSANWQRVSLANKQRLYGSKTINTSLESIASVDSLWMKQKYGHGTKLSLFRKWTIDVCGPVLERNYNTRTDRPNSHLHLYNALSRYAQTNGLFEQRN